MKIDIQDIKFWMDAIRNSDNRDRTLESFWGGQLQSKTWLIEKLQSVTTSITNANVVIHGGWNGVLASLLFNSDLGIKHITSVDIDPNVKETALTINKRQEMEGRFSAVTADMCDHTYNADIVINTSCEHISKKQYINWYNNIPRGCTVVIQSNNYYELDEHINCFDTLEDFVNECKLQVSKTYELELPKYKRFMIIGTKHD